MNSTETQSDFDALEKILERANSRTVEAGRRARLDAVVKAMRAPAPATAPRTDSAKVTRLGDSGRVQ